MTNEHAWTLAGGIAAFALNGVGWMFLRAVRRWDNNQASREQFKSSTTRRFQILQDRYGFDFTEHGTGADGADDRHGHVLPRLDNGSGDDSVS